MQIYMLKEVTSKFHPYLQGTMVLLTKVTWGSTLREHLEQAQVAVQLLLLDAYLFLDLLEALVQEEMRTVQLDLVLPCHLHIMWMKIRLSVIKMAVIVVLMRFRKKGKGKNWSKREDELLIAAWVHNSCDPIDGNSKRAETYWKEVAAEYNKYATKEQKKTVGQCKNHWTKTTKKVTKFNGIYNVEKSTWPSGSDDKQLMERVRAKYMSVAKTKRPFPYEHWWEYVRKEAKWRRSYSVEEMNKRNKLNALGAYSSPTQAIDEEGELQRPPGRNTSKDAKDKHKSSSKSKCSGSLTSESVDKFNEIQLRKSIAAEKMADATLIQAEATKVQAEAENERVETEKEKIKVDKLSKYLDLLHKNTSAYDDAQKKRHEQVLNFLANDLFG
uniref:Myb-like domain-containing protein n=1 Tax=Aegilops tauschii subsp. strangulata TaxID=200361 RepID=A0A453MDH4_AEGTS